MKFKQYIDEVFNTSYKFKKTGGSKFYNEYEFTDGYDYFDVFVKNGYTDNDKTFIKADFSKEGDFELSPSEEPFKIFSTILKILEAESYTDYDILIIEADKTENNRLKLYKRFAQSIVKKTPFNKIEIENDGNYIKINILK